MLQAMVITLPWIMPNTLAVLRQLLTQTFPRHILPPHFDVKELSTNIPIDQGIQLVSTMARQSGLYNEAVPPDIAIPTPYHHTQQLLYLPGTLAGGGHCHGYPTVTLPMPISVPGLPTLPIGPGCQALLLWVPG